MGASFVARARKNQTKPKKQTRLTVTKDGANIHEWSKNNLSKASTNSLGAATAESFGLAWFVLESSKQTYAPG